MALWHVLWPFAGGRVEALASISGCGRNLRVRVGQSVLFSTGLPNHEKTFEFPRTQVEPRHWLVSSRLNSRCIWLHHRKVARLYPPGARPSRLLAISSGQHATNVFRQHFAPRPARNKP